MSDRSRWRTCFHYGGFGFNKIWTKENSSASFIPEHLLKIHSVIENVEKRQRWKLVRNSDSYTLIVKFPAKDDKGQGKQQSPLKKRASGVVSSQHKDKEQASSDVRLIAQPKKKEKKKENSISCGSGS